MTYNFFLLDRDDAKDGTRIGYAYAKLNEDKWISKNSDQLAAYLTIGFVKGCDHIVSDGKVYSIMKSYTDLDNNATLFVCVESTVGCDNKKIFNNLDRSSIIVDNRKKTSSEETEEDTP